MKTIRPAVKTEPLAFRLEQALVDAMRELKKRDGVAMTEQVRRALREWLGQRGIEVEAPAKTARRRR